MRQLFTAEAAMAPAILRVALLALFVAACETEPVETTEGVAEGTVDLAAEEQAIEGIVARWNQAIDARDTTAIANFYADSAAFMAPGAPPAIGREVIRNAWSGLFALPNLTMDIETNEIEVSEAGDMAWERGSYTMSFDGPGGRVEDAGKYLVVWEKVNGQWQAVADIFNSNRPTS